MIRPHLPLHTMEGMVTDQTEVVAVEVAEVSEAAVEDAEVEGATAEVAEVEGAIVGIPDVLAHTTKMTDVSANPIANITRFIIVNRHHHR